ncbi:hypothetical protein U9M48_023018 [Paspalum notatum var. saurae]|uniref:Brr2 N-terminal helicase PWI domain-containing protein n=1 Tax=Paspalum notatum var. saurae TaxID=547442 RepID=A0AAQ3TM84_PASNO
MSNLGGGAEAHTRFNQYEYGANSIVVLITDSRPRDDTHEPTGEPETLWGRINPKSFDDRAVQNKPPELKAKLSKSRDKNTKRDASAAAADAKRRRHAACAQEASVLSLTGDVVYKPQTNETRAAYEALLSLIQQLLGGQPLDIIAGAADEVLATLKNDKIKNPDKKKKSVEMLLGAAIPNQLFDQLVSTGKLITDFDHPAAVPSGGAMDATLDDDVGVTVEFEEDEDHESDFDQVQDDLDEDDAAEFSGHGGMQMGGELDDDDDMQNANQRLAVNVQDIDAYWLQRKMSQAYGDIDAQQSQMLAEDILKVIGEGDDRDVENRLVMLLDYEKFDLIKLLLRNRLKIVWCTRLARAEDQEQRKKIEEEMASE